MPLLKINDTSLGRENLTLRSFVKGQFDQVKSFSIIKGITLIDEDYYLTENINDIVIAIANGSSALFYRSSGGRFSLVNEYQQTTTTAIQIKRDPKKEEPNPYQFWKEITPPKPSYFPDRNKLEK